MERHAGDARERYIALMGEELGKTFAVFSNDLMLAFAYWRAYGDLYSSPEQVEVLSDVAHGQPEHVGQGQPHRPVIAGPDRRARPAS